MFALFRYQEGTCDKQSLGESWEEEVRVLQ